MNNVNSIQNIVLQTRYILDLIKENDSLYCC